MLFPIGLMSEDPNRESNILPNPIDLFLNM